MRSGLALGQIVFFLQNSSKGFGEYTRLCKQNHVDPVQFVDQKPLLKFLGAEGDKALVTVTTKKTSTPATPTNADDAGERVASPVEKVRKASQLEADGGLATAKYKRPRVSFAIDETDGGDVDSMSGVEMGEDVLKSRAQYHEMLDNLKNVPYNVNSKEDQLKFNRENISIFLDADSTEVNKQLRKEIPMTDIKQVMNLQISTNKPIRFSSIVFDTLASVKQDEKARKKLEEKKLARLKQNEKHAAAAAIVTQVKDPRINTNAVWQEHLGGEEDLFASIDTTGSNLLSGFSKTTDADVAAAEAATLATSVAIPLKQRQQQALTQQQVNHQAKHAANKKRPKIVVVPASISSLLNIYNARSLLEDGSYKTTEECRKQYQSKPKYVSFMKPVRKSQQEIHVIEDPRRLRKKDWERVVAIFTDGKTWQFKGWITENPTELFTRYKGFHLAYEDSELNDNIKNWPIKVLKVSRLETKRHVDRTVQKEFWESVRM